MITEQQYQQMLARVNRLKVDIARECPRPEEIRKKHRIRQDRSQPNKLERDAMEHLRRKSPGVLFFHHAIRLQLANGCWYSPDIVGINYREPLSIYEIKGKHAWDDAIVKLKVAARMWPMMQFHLVWKDDGQWSIQGVEP